MPADTVWSLVRKSSTLLHITRGVLGFTGAEHFPADWAEGDAVETRLLFFGFIPGWRHRLTLFKLSNTERVLYTHENGGPVSSWDHLIMIEEIDNRTCLYIDNIKIEAGIITPLIGLFAHILFRYRQRRLHGLLRETDARYPHGASARQTETPSRAADAGLTE